MPVIARRTNAMAPASHTFASRRKAVETKEAVRALLDRLPDDCSVDDVLYHLNVLQAVEHGQAEVAAARTISHKDVERAMRGKWL